MVAASKSASLYNDKAWGYCSAPGKDEAITVGGSSAGGICGDQTWGLIPGPLAQRPFSSPLESFLKSEFLGNSTQNQLKNISRNFFPESGMENCFFTFNAEITQGT